MMVICKNVVLHRLNLKALLSVVFFSLCFYGKPVLSGEKQVAVQRGQFIKRVSDVYNAAKSFEESFLMEIVENMPEELAPLSQCFYDAVTHDDCHPARDIACATSSTGGSGGE